MMVLTDETIQGSPVEGGTAGFRTAVPIGAGLPGETVGTSWRGWLRRNLRRCYLLGRSRL
jgi:hypothetical protein